jgi:hypothetical protein
MKNEQKLKEEIINNVKQLKSEKVREINEAFKRNRVEFSLEDPNLREKLNKISCTTGIYFFEVNMEDFYRTHFEHDGIVTAAMRDGFLSKVKCVWDLHKNGNAPLFSIIKAKKHFNLKTGRNLFKQDWIPFYIGKINIRDTNESVPEGLQGRILEHIFGTKNESTYAMKLKDKVDFKEQVNFRVSYCELKGYENEDIYWVVSLFEREVRQIYIPIVGKQ